MLKDILSFSSEGRIEVKNQKKEIGRLIASIIVLYAVLHIILEMAVRLIYEEATKKYLLIFPIVIFIILGLVWFFIQTCYAWATIFNPNKVVTIDQDKIITPHGGYIHITHLVKNIDCFKLRSAKRKRYSLRNRLILSGEGVTPFVLFEIDVETNSGEYYREDIDYIAELALMIERVTERKVVISGDGLAQDILYRKTPPPADRPE